MATVYLTSVEAATRLGVSPTRIRQFCQAGRLGQRIGRNWAITEAQCDKFAKIERLSGGAGHKRSRKRKAGG